MVGGQGEGGARNTFARPLLNFTRMPRQAFVASLRGGRRETGEGFERRVVDVVAGAACGRRACPRVGGLPSPPRLHSSSRPGVRSARARSCSGAGVHACCCHAW